jgi:hypothetical protein
MTDFVPHRAVWMRAKGNRSRDELFSLTSGYENYFRAGMSDSFIRFARTNDVDFGGPVLELGWQSGRIRKRVAR